MKKLYITLPKEGQTVGFEVPETMSYESLELLKQWLAFVIHSIKEESGKLDVVPTEP